MDRKARKREFKDTVPPMGVYRVRNIQNGKSLIGSSVNLPAVLNRHRAQLRMGRHSNSALQRDWNECGAAVFVFEVIDTLERPDRPDYDPTEDLQQLENLWLEKLSPFDS